MFQQRKAMQQGDLVRVWWLENLNESLVEPELPFDPSRSGTFAPVPRIGIVVEYNKWEKIVTVLFQDSGKSCRIPARDVELLKRTPENTAALKAAYKKTENT